MAIIESNETVSKNVSGFQKSIEASSQSMMLDNLQVFMYQKPIPSTVRECTSNAIDSIKEKKIAIEILKGVSKVSDYFVEKEGDIYKDSKFDFDYYDLEWLNTSDEVLLTYSINPDVLGRDEFIIKDNGVGLGKIRLEKYFSVGYSSKRLTSQTLGAFGLGNKSPLSTGVESYRIISRYNGCEFCFDVFSHKVECVYSKWNEDGTENDFYEFETVTVEKDVDGIITSSPYKAYYKKTTSKNSLEIVLEVKKHNKASFYEAVRAQLMYFTENIKFVELNGERHVEIPFKSKVIFENDDILLSDSNYFSRPHFVLKNVSYGAVDFRELELENRHGSIGIKVNMEEIDVSPSRESIIYNTKTKNVILQKYNKITDTVTDLVQKSLKSEDFIEWIRSCNNVFFTSNFGGAENSVILSRLSGMIDKLSLNLKYDKANITYNSDINQFLPKYLKSEHVSTTSNWDSKTRSYINRIKRENNTSLITFNKPCFIQLGEGSGKTTKFLIEKNKSGFIIFKIVSPFDELDVILTDFYNDNFIYEDSVNKGVRFINATIDKEKSDQIANTIQNFMLTISFLKLIRESKHSLIYDDINVPVDFKFDADNEDTLDSTNDDLLKLEAAKKVIERRKNNAIYVAKTYKNLSGNNSWGSFEWNNTKFEDDCEVVYGTSDDEENLIFCSRLVRSHLGFTDKLNLCNGSPHAWNTKIKILKVAKNNLKYMKSFTHVNDFLMQTNKKTLTTNDFLKNAINSNFISHNLLNSTFFCNFDLFDQSLHDDYKELMDILKKSPTSILTNTPIIKTIESAVEFQKFILENPEAEEEVIDSLGVKLLGMDAFDEINNVEILDVKIYEKVQRLNLFAKVYGALLENIEVLKDPKKVIKETLEKDIRAFIASKVDQLELSYPNLNYK